jgi:biotin carboxyl carrier protein
MKVRREFVRDGETVVVSAEHIEGDRWRVRIGEVVREYHAQPLGDGGVRLAPVGEEFDRSFVAYGAPAGKEFMVRVNGRTHTLAAPAGKRGGGAGSDGTIRAPMTGTVLDVLCKPGDVVAADQTLVVLSAMKMEHKLKAGVAGTVAKVPAAKGGAVDQGTVLAVVEPAAAEEKE